MLDHLIVLPVVLPLISGILLLISRQDDGQYDQVIRPNDRADRKSAIIRSTKT